MVGSHDFEQARLAKLARSIDEIIGKDIRAEVMAANASPMTLIVRM